MVKPPTAAKGGSALLLSQGTGRLLSPRHEAAEGVIGLRLAQKVPRSPSSRGLGRKCEWLLRLSSIMNAEERGGEDVSFSLAP